ncbi:MAG: hypothetical protein L0I76_28590, partial [Pseudonocardia sp.]|nr:hypothetical protein [Pseudonocardia sp.]
MAHEDVLARLSEVDDEQLNTAHGEITGRINDLKPKVADRSLTPDELTELQALTDTFKQVGGEVTKRTEARDQAYAAIDETVAQVPDPEGEKPAEEQPAAEGEQAPESQAEQTEQPAEGEQATQTAAPAEATAQSPARRS